MIKTNSKYSEVVNSIDQSEVIRLYTKDKWSSCKIAKKFNCLPHHILQILKENKVKTLKKNQLDADKIIILYDRNFSIAEIAKEFDVSSGTIISILNENEIETLKSKSMKVDIEEVIKMYREGKTLSSIASCFRVSSATIKKILEENQIELRTRRKNKSRVLPSFNNTSLFFFKYYDKLNNTKGLYGKNEYWVKELGYSLDYINFDLKLIIEWDEKGHKYKLEKDKKREEEILSLFPDFKFKRIKE